MGREVQGRQKLRKQAVKWVVAKLQGDTNCFFLRGNEWSRSYREINQHPQSSVELYCPWISGPLRVSWTFQEILHRKHLCWAGNLVWIPLRIIYFSAGSYWEAKRAVSCKNVCTTFNKPKGMLLYKHRGRTWGAGVLQNYRNRSTRQHLHSQPIPALTSHKSITLNLKGWKCNSMHSGMGTQE